MSFRVVIRALAGVLLAATALVVVLASVAGCGGAPTAPAAETPYCVNAAGVVFPPSACGGGDPAYWLWLAPWPHPYGYGQTIVVNRGLTVVHVHANDPAARARYGLPRTGGWTPGYRATPPGTTTQTRTSTTRTTTTRTTVTRTTGRR